MRAVVGAICLAIWAVPAIAQNAEFWMTQRVSDQRMELVEVGPDDAPTGNRMTLDVFATGTLSVVFNGEHSWGIWSVNDLGQFCTQQAELDSNNQLHRAGDEEECVVLVLDGENLRAYYQRRSGGEQQCRGTIRPM